MAYECREMIQYLENEAPKRQPDGLHVKNVTCKFFTDVVMRCGFGVYGNSFIESEATLQKFGEEFATFGMWKTGRILLAFFAHNMPTFLRTRLMDINEQNFFRLLITELIQYRERNRVFRNDYLQMLMHIKNMGIIIKGKNTIRVAGITIEYTDEDIASHALTFFLTGCELPSNTLTCALYELALNPEIQIRLRAEIDSVLTRHCGGLTYDAVSEMSFLDMVLKETMRKYPACPMMFRLCTKSCQFPLPDGGNFILEKGTAINIPVEGIQMDSEYFSEPEKFDPERFSEERKDSIKHFTFLPYGGGPRQCFGIKFGEAMMKAGIVAIVSHFEIRTTPKTPVKIVKDPCTFMLPPKGGMWLNFVRRQ
ncbi:cytochrome P450 6k1 [Anabrus simplex]|uniref:cytochrome P450 6k1 n=1 Tax=Anabrus simplex TaxID=316456 RepID=UPI0035A3BF9D